MKRGDFYSNATVVATGSGGSIRVTLDQLRRIGLGEQVIKTALAALVSQLPDDAAPDQWSRRGGILTVSGQLVTDLEWAASDLQAL